MATLHDKQTATPRQYNNCDQRVGNSFCNQPKGHTGKCALICTKIDAHVHPDTISYGNVDKQTVFWLDRHPSLVEYEAAQLKALWEAAPELLESCWKAIELINKPRNEGVFEARAVLAAAIAKADVRSA